MPSTFKLKLEQFGELRMDPESSRILTKEECFSLKEMTEYSNCILLYRATRDGFEGSVFHEKCDGKENTITIIETNGNYVFGGFTAAKWASYDGHIADTKAFLFSLRRDGVSCKHKFMVEDSNNAILGYPRYGPIFGNGPDILINNNSNTNIGSYTYLGETYHYPRRNKVRETFLAGSYDKWLTTEIEVYQIKK
jgi:hypothetical protein